MQVTKCTVTLGLRAHVCPCHPLLSLHLSQIRGLPSFFSFSFQVIWLQELRVWDSAKILMIDVCDTFNSCFAIFLQKLWKQVSVPNIGHAVSLCKTVKYFGEKFMSDWNVAPTLGNSCKPEIQPSFSPIFTYYSYYPCQWICNHKACTFSLSKRI